MSPSTDKEARRQERRNKNWAWARRMAQREITEALDGRDPFPDLDLDADEAERVLWDLYSTFKNFIDLVKVQRYTITDKELLVTKARAQEDYRLLEGFLKYLFQEMEKKS